MFAALESPTTHSSSCLSSPSTAYHLPPSSSLICSTFLTACTQPLAARFTHCSLRLIELCRVARSPSHRLALCTLRWLSLPPFSPTSCYQSLSPHTAATTFILLPPPHPSRASWARLGLPVSVLTAVARTMRSPTRSARWSSSWRGRTEQAESSRAPRGPLCGHRRKGWMRLQVTARSSLNNAPLPASPSLPLSLSLTCCYVLCCRLWCS